MSSTFCEIINIGTELLSYKSSTSDLLLAGSLKKVGILPEVIITVGDKKYSVKNALSTLSDNIPLVFIIGGLGSTLDDITVEALSEYLSIKTEFSKESMQNVTRYFSRRELEVPDACRRQAYIIKGAEVLENTVGSCPCQIVKTKNKTYILLPGPVNEVKQILADGLLQRLKDKFSKSICKTKTIRVAGKCEQELSSILSDLIKTEKHLEGKEIQFSIQTTPEGADIIISISGNDEMLIDEILHKLKREIFNILGDDIYAEDYHSLEYAIGKQLTRLKSTLAVAESCTGGMLSSRITDVPGSSMYFKEGIVVYSSSIKSERLGVPRQLIEDKGAVSKEVALEMASKIKKMSSVDYALSVTGYAGPSADASQETGIGFIALAGPNILEVFSQNFSGTRIAVKEKFSAAALEILWRYLKSVK